MQVMREWYLEEGELALPAGFEEKPEERRVDF